MLEIFGYIVLGMVSELIGQLIILLGVSLGVALDNIALKVLSLILAVIGWAVAIFMPIWCLLKIIFIIIGMING